MAETSGPIGLGVKLPFATAEEFVTRYRENVTRGGVYLRAKKVLPPGTLVNLDLKLTSGERLIHGSAVVHFVTGQSGTGPSGLGLKFLGLDDTSKKFVDDMLAGHPGAFTDVPPVPAGVGPVQYADNAQDTAVTREMSIQGQDLFGAQPVPMPAPTPPPLGAAPLPSTPPFPSTLPFPAAPEEVPLPALGSVAPPIVPAINPVAPAAPSVAPVIEPLGGVASTPFPFPTPARDTPRATPPVGVPFATPEVEPRPVEVTPFSPQGASATAGPAPIDSSLLDRLDVDPSDPRAVLGLRPAALPDEAGSAAARMKRDLHLDEPGDPVTTRLRRMLARRLDAAVESIVRPAAKDSPAIAAARSLVDGDPQAAYAAGTDGLEPQAKALAFAAACAMASQTRSAEWIDKASLLAKDGASASFLGSSWILLAQAAHAAGDATELKKALEEAAKQDPTSPFAPKAAGAQGKSGSMMMPILLLVVGLAGGFAGGMYGGPMLGLTGKGKPVEIAKAEPAKTEPAKTEPAKTEPAKTEPGAIAATGPATTEPAKTDAGTIAATEPTKTEPATTEPIKVAAVDPTKTEPATPKLSPEEEKKILEEEAAFLRKVQGAMDRDESCLPFLVKLGDITATSPKPTNKGLAMILRARCFDANDKPAQAKAEYKKYTKWFPRGPFIDEAMDSN